MIMRKTLRVTSSCWVDLLSCSILPKSVARLAPASGSFEQLRRISPKLKKTPTSSLRTSVDSAERLRNTWGYSGKIRLSVKGIHNECLNRHRR